MFLWTNKAGVSWKLHFKQENEYECLDCPYPNQSYLFKVEK
jgi:hypothetical protein